MSNQDSQDKSASAAEPPKPAVKKPLNPADILKSLKETGVGGDKRKKPSTLDQANQDWHQAKIEDGFDEELKQATKSKFGFLDRQAFLDRTDARQFEQEREIRNRQRAKNQNSST